MENSLQALTTLALVLSTASTIVLSYMVTPQFEKKMMDKVVKNLQERTIK